VLFLIITMQIDVTGSGTADRANGRKRTIVLMFL
jgi:hypothetical protein